jgi:sugar phosphate isomerase/epimerase
MWTLSGFADEISPEPEEQCAVLRDLGIGYLEMRSAWGLRAPDLSDERLARLAAVIDGYGMRVSSIGSPIGKIPVDADFAGHLRDFDRVLEVAGVLGAPYIRLFSFYLPAGADPARYRDEVLRRMAALVDRAAGHDVVLLHENEKEIYGDVPERCRDIVESVGSDRLRLAWDPANFVQCGVRPFTDGYRQLRPYLAYVQVKDATLDDGAVCVAGAGDGEWPQTLRALRDDGYDGFFSMEPHLAEAGPAGGFSGPDLFGTATGAFTALLRAEGIGYA